MTKKMIFVFLWTGLSTFIYFCLFPSAKVSFQLMTTSLQFFAVVAWAVFTAHMLDFLKRKGVFIANNA